MQQTARAICLLALQPTHLQPQLLWPLSSVSSSAAGNTRHNSSNWSTSYIHELSFHSMQLPSHGHSHSCCTRCYSTSSPAEAFLDSLVNYEKAGLPKDSGIAASKAKFDLQRMHRLLKHLGDPQTKWPVVHVAGSKGKGSSVTLLSSILRAAGYKTGVYTSPHLHHIRERISISPAGGLALDDFEHLVSSNLPQLQKALSSEGGVLSQFEVMTALAYRCFADAAVDISVVETGMGGTTDATNVFQPDTLQAAVVTQLGLEHVEALGGSLHSIATAKAGIMKPGRPAVLSQQQHEEALQVLLSRAQELGCAVVRAEQQVMAKARGMILNPSDATQMARDTVDVEAAVPHGSDKISLNAVQTRMVGSHQHSNIQTAVAASLVLKQQGWKLHESHIQQGLESAFLPGRLQVTQVGDDQPPSTYVVLDGAHTAESASALAHNLRQLFPTQPVVLVLAMAADKDHRAVAAALRALEPKVVVFTSVPIGGAYHRSAAPGTLAAHWQAASILSRAKPFRCRELIQASIQAAFEKARHELRAFGSPGVICITGSLHAVAQACKIAELPGVAVGV